MGAHPRAPHTWLRRGDERPCECLCPVAAVIEEDCRMLRGDLADLAAFVAVADNLSFRAAAAHLGVTPSALSHAMRQLEEHVGVRLLHRTTRSVSVTDAGLRLLERLRPGINQITSALEDLNEERQRPFGRLKISGGSIAAAAGILAGRGRFPSTPPDGPPRPRGGEEPPGNVPEGGDPGSRRRAR